MSHQPPQGKILEGSETTTDPSDFRNVATHPPGIIQRKPSLVAQLHYAVAVKVLVIEATPQIVSASIARRELTSAWPNPPDHSTS
jgi:hypothetical protein